MREIKFRAWDSKSKRMLEVMTLCFMKMTGNVAHLETWDCRDIDGVHKTNFPDEINIMQYTGLKDKNGVEIYEGDVLENINIKLIIKWDKSNASFYGESTKENNYDNWINNLSELDEFCGIIGNIYENPGLLKEER